MKIILGSYSSSRRKILEFFSLPFRQEASHFDEESIPFLGDPAYHCILLSQKKSEVLAQKFPEEIILTADSVVFANNALYNKPANEQEAKEYLLSFSGKWQKVITGVTVRQKDRSLSLSEETRILFNPLSEKQIETFHKTHSCLDKAGGFAIEKSGSLLVSKIEGCHYNVMGLPINTTKELLLHFGIDLWDFLKP